MEIYKYKIWTGNIPGMSSPRCEEPQLIRPPQGPLSPALDCVPCEALGDDVTIMNACMDCYNGLVNVCCPARGESCCGLIEDPCLPLYEMSVEDQNKYCANCPQNSNSVPNIIGSTYNINRFGSNSFNDPLGVCRCCNRTARNDNDSKLTIFLDQDYNDIGHYTMWDGTIDQQDTFSNFVVEGDPLNVNTVTVLNTTDFNFFKFLEGIEYTIDWGDGISPPTTVTAPVNSTTHTYGGAGSYIINIQMSAPWGVSSVSHSVTVPYQTGANIWASVVNTGQTYTFTPPGFSTPVSMDYETSDWGPLDSGLDINGYVTSFYNPAAITGYLIEGVTDSMLSSLQSYNPNDQTTGLPPGYMLNNPVNVAGQSRLPDGSFVNNLQGTITQFDPDPINGWTAYTLTNCGTLPPPCQTFEMLDHVSGETIFQTLSYGMNPEDYLLRECGYAIQGACDVCNATQVYFDGSSYVTQDVFNDRGVYDVTDTYEPTDFVYASGCCFYAISTVIPGIEPDPLDINSDFWRLCYGSCPIEDQLPSRYDCVDGTCVLISPTSTYYSTAQFQGATTADALAACIAHPCVPTQGDPLEYVCDQGVCVPCSPTAPCYGNATNYSGPTALADCQDDVTNGICVNTTTNYNCIPDGMGGTMCQAAAYGIYPDLPTCNLNCGGTINVYDWYCVNVAVTPLNPTGTECGAAPTGSIPGNAITPLQGPYPSQQDCQNNGCGSLNYKYYCRCEIGSDDTIVDLTSAGHPGKFGGTACVSVLGGPAGGFDNIADCEDNCLSWDCDGHGNCDSNSVSSGTIGAYCAEDDLINGGFKFWTDQTYIDVPGCVDDCPIPSSWACMGGSCTELLEPPNQTGCINPSHVNNGTAFNGSCIDWAFANNMPSQGCTENDEAQCNASLLSPCGGGCGPCDGIVNEMGMTEWPFRLYDSGEFYNAFDVVIGFAFPDSPNNSQFKYWYKPFPICDPTLGVITAGLPPQTYDCSDPAIIAVCESSAYGSGTYHPCTDLSAPACDTPPIINMPPPNLQGQSRYASQTCWEPCFV